jgi:hypothetical protein
MHVAEKTWAMPAYMDASHQRLAALNLMATGSKACSARCAYVGRRPNLQPGSAKQGERPGANVPPCRPTGQPGLLAGTHTHLFARAAGVEQPSGSHSLLPTLRPLVLACCVRAAGSAMARGCWRHGPLHPSPTHFPLNLQHFITCLQCFTR